MKQTQKKATQTTASNNEELLQKLEKLNTVEVKETKKTRIVYLKYKSCCGCGCNDMNVRRTVPFDSPLKDGDRIKEIQKGDEF